MTGDIAKYWAQMWRIERPDGVVVALTDHDFDLIFEGDVYHANSALQSSEVESAIGLEAENSEFLGGVDGELIVAEDLKAGLYQDAKVRHFLFDFQSGEIEHEIFNGQIAKITFGEQSFRAELTSDLAKIDFVYGRRFNRECDVDFCSAACGLERSAYAVQSAVNWASGQNLKIDLVDFSYPLANGAIEFLGRTQGIARYAIREAQVRGDVWEIELWREPLFSVKAGDAVMVMAGCDKSFACCKDTYRNALNFRGFPHMPGEQILNRRADRNG